MPYRDEARCQSAPHSVTPFVAVICLTPVPLLRMTDLGGRDVARADPSDEATKRRPKGGLLPPSGRRYSSSPFGASGEALATDAATAIRDTANSPRRSIKL